MALYKEKAFCILLIADSRQCRMILIYQHLQRREIKIDQCTCHDSDSDITNALNLFKITNISARMSVNEVLSLVKIMPVCLHQSQNDYISYFYAVENNKKCKKNRNQKSQGAEV